MYKLENKFESPLIMNNLYFTQLEFVRKEGEDFSKKLAVVIHLNHEDNKNKHIVRIQLKIRNEEESIAINAEAVGEFALSPKSELDEETKVALLTKNTVSIMMPYIRSQISLLTSQPGMEPIILPPYDINQMAAVEDDEED